MGCNHHCVTDEAERSDDSVHEVQEHVQILLDSLSARAPAPDAAPSSHTQGVGLVVDGATTAADAAETGRACALAVSPRALLAAMPFLMLAIRDCSFEISRGVSSGGAPASDMVEQ